MLDHHILALVDGLRSEAMMRTRGILTCFLGSGRLNVTAKSPAKHAHVADHCTSAIHLQVIAGLGLSADAGCYHLEVCYFPVFVALMLHRNATFLSVFFLCL
jgi:hypothetical protein